MNVIVELKLNRLPEIERAVALGARQVAVVGAEATVADAREQIESEIKSGVQYSGLPNRSSAPGEAPANQLGALLESVKVDDEPDVIGIAVDAVAGDADADYAAFLEFGTSRMAPRPFMGPAAVVGEEAAAKETAALGERLGNM